MEGTSLFNNDLFMKRGISTFLKFLVFLNPAPPHNIRRRFCHLQNSLLAVPVPYMSLLPRRDLSVHIKLSVFRSTYLNRDLLISSVWNITEYSIVGTGPQEKKFPWKKRGPRLW